MFLGKVVGTVWSTKKAPDLEGVKFLIIHPIDLSREPTRNIVVAADRLGAGVGRNRAVCLRQSGPLRRRQPRHVDRSRRHRIVDRMDLQEVESQELLEAAERLLGRDNGTPGKK
jgi:microcompartment protein CcmK/EutM